MFYCVYKDNGASGCCGQLMSITAPRTILMVFPTESLLRDMLDKLNNGCSGRVNARIEEVFSDEDLGYLPVQVMSPDGKWVEK